MHRLIKGIQKFQQSYFKKEEQHFSKLSKGQSPDVLFFACSDSRVDPNLLTQSKPGELFIVKNVGNIIPANNPFWKKSCTAAAIEFALGVLNISDIVVCGHSDCGALKALYYDKKDLSGMPNLRDWVETANPVKDLILKHHPDPLYKERQKMTEKKHIIAQMENLKSYPLVVKAIKEEKLNLHGWYYEIETGAVYAFNRFTCIFEKINYNDEDFIAPCLDDTCGDLQ